MNLRDSISIFMLKEKIIKYISILQQNKMRMYQNFIEFLGKSTRGVFFHMVHRISLLPVIS